ncbi:hypothetical protein Malapachy_1258 [Malassezia pachydermatis]|uniref:Uncharacterized protein n=1 Tax=Malassezia pachydermatis TaxID=77020 RepID=A0A0M9VQ37_9BASI|nr:hypothetical protein Malapachy_1258 [Malassezia pachydermatis]KOS15109.1 hypothetical protein Malapachy_1258 [Malassezia pachydermatis]
MDFFKPDQSSDWNNISLGTNVAFLTESSLTSLKLRIISEDTSMHSDADSSTRVELKVENVHARALYTGQGFEEMCIQLPTLELYEVLDALRYHPIIRINMEPDPMSSLPDSPTWVLGHILVCEGGWDTIFPLGARNDFAICARQNTEGFDIEIAPAQLLVDCTMFARLLPFWQAFSSGASSASIPSANTSLIPWEFCHFLLSLLPIISITCSKAQMAIRVPYVYASEERSSTYLARGVRCHVLAEEEEALLGVRGISFVSKAGTSQFRTTITSVEAKDVLRDVYWIKHREDQTQPMLTWDIAPPFDTSSDGLATHISLAKDLDIGSCDDNAVSILHALAPTSDTSVPIVQVSLTVRPSASPNVLDVQGKAHIAPIYIDFSSSSWQSVSTYLMNMCETTSLHFVNMAISPLHLKGPMSVPMSATPQHRDPLSKYDQMDEVLTFSPMTIRNITGWPSLVREVVTHWQNDLPSKSS